MAGREYLDFDLAIEAHDDGRYFSRVLASPVGPAKGSFVFPFSAEKLENYLLKLGPTRPVVRGVDSPYVETAREFGSAIFQSVFSGKVGESYVRSLDAAHHEGKGLRLRLRLTEAPDLGGLPWEFLHDEEMGDFLVLSERRPLVRYPELPTVVEPLGVEAPLRILLVESIPNDYAELNVKREHQLLRQALEDPISDGRVEITVLDNPTLSALRKTLRRNNVHVLHYSGHGGFETRTDSQTGKQISEGVLLFEDRRGRGRKVSASSLGTILHDHDPLRLVVLNACEGARTGTDDPFSGVAPALVRRGAPAVIAMQFEITDEAAITFSQEFYMAIADGYPVDAATASARIAIFAEGNGLEWATPVLYLRSPDGNIFDVQAPPPPPLPPVRDDDTDTEPPPPVHEVGDNSKPDVISEEQQAELRRVALVQALERGSDASEAGKWEEAKQTYEEILVENPDNDAALQGLERAVQELKRPPPDNRRWLLVGGLALVALLIILLIANLSPDDNGGTTTSVEVETPDATYLATAFAAAPAIDGLGDEWSSVSPHPARSVAEGGDPDPGVESSWRFGWDADAFYVFVEVTDPDPLTTPFAGEPEALFRGDGVNFIFGPDPTGLADDVGLREGEDVMILIGPSSPAVDDAVVGSRVRGVADPEAAGANDCENTQFVGSGTAPGVDAAVVKTETGYNVEAAVPWEELFVETPPTAGTEHGIIFTAAHAGDGTGDNPRGSRSSHPSRAEAKHCPGRWGETIGIAP